MKRATLILGALALLLGSVEKAEAGLISLAIVNADSGDVPTAQLMATG